MSRWASAKGPGSRRRKQQGEARAVPGRAHQQDIAAHGSGEAPGDGEAEADSARRIADALVPLENPVLVGGMDSRALVGNRDADLAVAPLQDHRDIPLRGRMADGIAQDIDQDLYRSAILSERHHRLVGA